MGRRLAENSAVEAEDRREAQCMNQTASPEARSSTGPRDRLEVGQGVQPMDQLEERLAAAQEASSLPGQGSPPRCSQSYPRSRMPLLVLVISSLPRAS